MAVVGGFTVLVLAVLDLWCNFGHVNLISYILHCTDDARHAGYWERWLLNCNVAVVRTARCY